DPGAPRLSPCRRLALDLRGQRRGCPLSECLRLGRTGLRESAGPEGDGPHAVRATISGCAARCSGPFRRTRHLRAEEVSRRAAPCGPSWSRKLAQHGLRFPRRAIDTGRNEQDLRPAQNQYFACSEEPNPREVVTWPQNSHTSARNGTRIALELGQRKQRFCSPM